jgi:BioD-like phosphotransacetylase family protein
MRAEHAVPLIRERTLLITPGDRDDLLEMALQLNSADSERVTGVILTGGFAPRDARLAELRAANLFTHLVQTDTYRSAQAVDEILVKTHATDADKIETIIRLVGGSLDIGDFLAHLG